MKPQFSHHTRNKIAQDIRAMRPYNGPREQWIADQLKRAEGFSTYQARPEIAREIARTKRARDLWFCAMLAALFSLIVAHQIDRYWTGTNAEYIEELTP